MSTDVPEVPMEPNETEIVLTEDEFNERSATQRREPGYWQSLFALADADEDAR
jgi:hypothetical protein